MGAKVKKGAKVEVKVDTKDKVKVDVEAEVEVDAEAKAKIIVEEAKQETKQEMARARKKLQSEIISLVAEATEVITGDKVDTKKDSEIIDRALTQGVER